MRKRLIPVLCAALAAALLLMPGTAAYAAGKDIVLSDTQSSEGFENHAMGAVERGPEPGMRAVYAESNHNMIVTYKFSPTDASELDYTAGAALVFWVYFSDIALLTNEGQVELNASGNVNDAAEMVWTFQRIIPQLEAGKWNRVALRMMPEGEGSNVTGLVDMSALNFIRIYNLGRGNAPYGEGITLKMLISDVRIQEMDVSGFTDLEKVLETRDFTGGEPTQEDLIVPPLTNGVAADSSAPESPYTPPSVRENAVPSPGVPAELIAGIALTATGVAACALWLVSRIRKKTE